LIKSLKNSTLKNLCSLSTHPIHKTHGSTKKTFCKNATISFKSLKKICGKSIRQDPTGPEEPFLTINKKLTILVFFLFWTEFKPQGGQPW
jgi:hypothetical protein